MKKKLSLLLACVMTFSMMSGCAKEIPPAADPAPPKEPEVVEPVTPEQPVEDPAPEIEAVDFAVLAGPTGVGAAKLLWDNESAEDAVYTTLVAATNDELTPALIKGELDIAAVATNVAANLSAKTEGGIQVLCVNTLGVLYILEKGDTVQNIADLKGKTMYAPANTKGANPEYILNHLLSENGVDPSEVDIQWIPATEITAKMTTEDAGICMLPVPAATAVMVKDPNVRQAVSLSDAWNELDQGALPMGCVVARTEFVEENPEAVEAFLAEYEQSIAFVADEANRSEAAEMVAHFGVTANAAIAAKAIPQCNLAFVTGQEMKDMLQNYYQILFQANPESIGKAMPYDSFYYGVE